MGLKRMLCEWSSWEGARSNIDAVLFNWSSGCCRTVSGVLHSGTSLFHPFSFATDPVRPGRVG